MTSNEMLQAALRKAAEEKAKRENEITEAYKAMESFFADYPFYVEVKKTQKTVVASVFWAGTQNPIQFTYSQDTLYWWYVGSENPSSFFISIENAFGSFLDSRNEKELEKMQNSLNGEKD
jgi:hypothetical protein